MGTDNYDRESPNIPNRDKSTHSTTAEHSSEVRKRHPEYHKSRADASPETYLLNIPGSEPPEDGVVNKDVPCEPFADTACYPLDDFNRTLAGGTYSGGSAFSTGVHYRGHESGESDGLTASPTPFTIELNNGIPLDTSVDSTLGNAAHSWVSGVSLGCGGLSFTFTGWTERSSWYKFTVPAHPASAAGITFGPITFVAPTGLAGGTVGQAEGALLLVNAEEPTGNYDGTAVTTLANGVSTTVYIPIGYIPAEATEFWIGVAPNWRADLGSYTCGFRWPWMDGKGNSAKGYTNETPTGTWQIWDASGDDWGYGSDGSDNPFFSGNLPWNVAASGGTFGYNGDHLYLTAAAGGQQTLVATMPGADEADVADDYDEELGEPWTSEYGVKMKARFRLTTAGSTSESGSRYLRFRWQDGRNEYSAEVHLGDASDAQGLTISDELNSANVDKDITEGSYMWVSLDTRNPGYLRGKLWTEGAAFGSGEPPIFDVESTVEDTTESGVTGNFFEIAMSVGNATGADQTIEVDMVCFANGADDCLWVQERIGQGDGIKNLFATAQAYKEGSLWFFVDGMHVRTVPDDLNKGTFYPVDYVAPADDAVLVARYRVDLNPDGD